MKLSHRFKTLFSIFALCAITVLFSACSPDTGEGNSGGKPAGFGDTGEATEPGGPVVSGGSGAGSGYTGKTAGALALYPVDTSTTRVLNVQGGELIVSEPNPLSNIATVIASVLTDTFFPKTAHVTAIATDTQNSILSSNRRKTLIAAGSTESGNESEMIFAPLLWDPILNSPVEAGPSVPVIAKGTPRDVATYSSDPLQPVFVLAQLPNGAYVVYKISLKNQTPMAKYAIPDTFLQKQSLSFAASKDGRLVYVFGIGQTGTDSFLIIIDTVNGNTQSLRFQGWIARNLAIGDGVLGLFFHVPATGKAGFVYINPYLANPIVSTLTWSPGPGWECWPISAPANSTSWMVSVGCHSDTETVPIRDLEHDTTVPAHEFVTYLVANKTWFGWTKLTMHYMPAPKGTVFDYETTKSILNGGTYTTAGKKEDTVYTYVLTPEDGKNAPQ